MPGARLRTGRSCLNRFVYSPTGDNGITVSSVQSSPVISRSSITDGGGAGRTPGTSCRYQNHICWLRSLQDGMRFRPIFVVDTRHNLMSVGLSTATTFFVLCRPRPATPPFADHPPDRDLDPPRAGRAARFVFPRRCSVLGGYVYNALGSAVQGDVQVCSAPLGARKTAQLFVTEAQGYPGPVEHWHSSRPTCGSQSTGHRLRGLYAGATYMPPARPWGHWSG